MAHMDKNKPVPAAAPALPTTGHGQCRNRVPCQAWPAGAR
jgi:hypothetical protein